MRQDFSNVTAAQRAELFPIIHKVHDPKWKEEYRKEAEVISQLFGEEQIFRIHHIGSTSVEGLLAKPTIDILVEVGSDFELSSVAEKMLNHGYVVNTPPQDLILFLKGYTPQGFEGQAFHIHVRYSGDWGELYFRDYLQAHPEVAEDYGRLKEKLRKNFSNDRDGYTDAKGEFINKYTELAWKEFPGRYTP